MSRSNVKYAKEMRDRAIADKKGLYTIDLINGSKRPGKLGSRITMQGPANAEDFKAVSDFILSFIKARESRDTDLLAACQSWVDYFEQLDRECGPDDPIRLGRQRFHGKRIEATKAALSKAGIL